MLDTVRASAYDTGMNKNTSTAEMIAAMKAMTTEERIAYVKANRPEMFAPVSPVASFGKAPKDGWKDSDRVAK